MITNLLNKTNNQSTEFRTKEWVEVNDVSNWIYETGKQTEIYNSMLKSSLCDYRDAYIPVEGTMIIAGARADAVAQRTDERNNQVTFKNCTTFTKGINQINNTQVDNAKYLDIMISMSTPIEYSDYYTNISESLWRIHGISW